MTNKHNIDPKTMTQDDANLIMSYVLQHPGKKLLSKLQTFTLDGDEESFELKQPIFVYPCTSMHDVFHVEVFPAAGKSSAFSTVFFCEQRYRWTSDSLTQTPSDYVIKLIFAHNKQMSLEEAAQKEVELTRLAGNAIKDPFFIIEGGEKFAVLLMKKYGDQNLTDILKIKLSKEVLIQFSLQLLDLFESQIFNHKIVHRDLKFENVRMTFDAIAAQIKALRIIDYGLSRLFDEIYNEFCGTLSYIAPECLPNDPSQSEITYKRDIYALGVLLVKLWRGTLFDPSTAIQAYNYAQNRIILNLGSGIDDLSADSKKELNKLFESMLAFNPDARPEISACRSVFFAMLLAIKKANANPEQQQSLDTCHDKVLLLRDEFAKQSTVKFGGQEIQTNLLQALADQVKTKLKPLPEDALVIKHFTDILNVNMLKNLQSKTEITAAMETPLEEIESWIKTMTGLVAAIESSLQNQKLTYGLHRISEQYHALSASLHKKMIKLPIELDSIMPFHQIIKSAIYNLQNILYQLITVNKQPTIEWPAKHKNNDKLFPSSVIKPTDTVAPHQTNTKKI